MTETDSTRKANSIDDLEPGTVWNGKFRLEAKLGAGGMAVVYKALHTQLDIIVALKLMPPSVASPQHSARFMREARVLSALNQANIVRLQAFGETEDGVHYMALEYAEGQTLEQVLQAEQSLVPSRAVAIAEQICAGLEAAHAEGVIHRDLKPSNIIIGTNADKETAKIIDFGIARVSGDRLRGKEQHTLTETLIGSPCYMSPEQCMGLSSIDARSDIYSLGCILYEMLCGQPPFKDDNYYTVLSAHIATPVSELPTKHACPASLRAIVLQCLKKEPDERFPDIVALSKALALIDWDTLRMLRGHSAQQKTAASKKVVLCSLSSLLALSGGLLLLKHRANTTEQEYKLPARIRNSSQLTPSTLPDRNHFWSTHTYAPERVNWYRNWLSKNGNSKYRADANYYLAQDLADASDARQEVRTQFRTAASLYADDMPRIRKERTEREVVLAYRNWSTALRALNDFATARKQLELALKDYQDSLSPGARGDLLKELAETALRQCDWKSAAKFSNEMAETLQDESDRNVEYIEANLLRARAAIGEGRKAQAIDIVDKTLQFTAPRTAKRDLAEINGLLGNFYQLSGLYSRAIAPLDLAREVHQATHPYPSLAMGNCFEGLRQWRQAEQAYQQNLSMAKNVVESEQWQPVIALVKLARFKEARIDLNKAIAKAFANCIPKAPSNRSACIAQMLQTSTLLSEQRQTELAGTVLKHAIIMAKSGNEGLLDNDPETLLNLAKALLLNREFKEAQSTAERLSSHLKATNASSVVAQQAEVLQSLALSYSGNHDRVRNAPLVQWINEATKKSSPDEYMAAILSCALISFNNENAPEVEWTYWLNHIRNKTASDKTQINAAVFAIEEAIRYDLCCGKGTFATKLYNVGNEVSKDDPTSNNKLRRRFGELLFSNGRSKEASELFEEACTKFTDSPHDVVSEIELLNITAEAFDRAGLREDAAMFRKKLSTICN